VICESCKHFVTGEYGGCQHPSFRSRVLKLRGAWVRCDVRENKPPEAPQATVEARQ
jgi:hypothetical protein